MLPEFFSHFESSYSTFHVADADGKVVCNAKGTKAGFSIADRQDFKDAMSSHQFVVGDINSARATGLTSIMFRYPVVNDLGNVFAVVTAQISTEQFDKVAAPIQLPANGLLVLLDRTNKVVVRKPAINDWIGKDFPNKPLMQLLRDREQGLTEAEGVDGTVRIYSIVRVEARGSRGMRVLVGFPISIIKGEIKQHFYQSMVMTFGLLVFLLVVAWFAVDAIVLRKVKILVGTLEEVRSREIAAGTRPPGADRRTNSASSIDQTAAEIERMLNLLREDSIRDPLTSLHNRRYLTEVLSRELIKAHQKGETIGVISADLDHFKRINDTFGHDVGDKVLVGAANILSQNIRGSDIVCRVGGEEFTIILPGASLDATRTRAEGICKSMTGLNVKHDDITVGTITISLGVTVFPDGGRDFETLLRSADRALYQAKTDGRNRVAVATGK
jgi:diguanylate cyclase (GGDEF)-like protein